MSAECRPSMLPYLERDNFEWREIPAKTTLPPKLSTRVRWTGGREIDASKASAARQRLRDIIRERSLMTGGSFMLASGRQSNMFFDMKPTMLDPEGANLIADAVLDRLGEPEVDAVGGLVLGAVPIVAVVCAKSFRRGRSLQGFFVRKEVKDHGTAKLIEGNLARGARAAVLEDVTTTGGSALRAVDAVRSAGAAVIKIVSVVDRLEGAADTFRAHGLPFEAVFTRDDFI
jgi:orotate phosphoribosyltransferase